MSLAGKVNKYVRDRLTLEEAVAILSEFERLEQDEKESLIESAERISCGNGVTIIGEMQRSAACLCLDRLMKNDMWPRPHDGGWILAPTSIQMTDEDEQNYADPTTYKHHRTLLSLLVSVDWDWIA